MDSIHSVRLGFGVRLEQERKCVRCGANYLKSGQCANHAQGCQGGWGEHTAEQSRVKHIDCPCWITGVFKQLPCPFHDGGTMLFPYGSFQQYLEWLKRYKRDPEGCEVVR